MLELYDYNGSKILNLKQDSSQIDGEAKTITHTEEINGLKELSFILPLYIKDGTENYRWEKIQNDLLVKYSKDDFEDYYIITGLEDEHENGILKSNVQCKHISYNLTKKGLDKYFGEDEEPSTAEVLLTKVLEGTGWSVGEVGEFKKNGVDKLRILKIDGKVTTMEQLNQLCELFQGFMKFNGNKTIDFKEEIGVDKSIHFRYKKNIKGVKRNILSEDIVTRLYCEGGSHPDNGLVLISDAEDNISKQPFIDDFSYYMDKTIDGVLIKGIMPDYLQTIVTDYQNNNTIGGITEDIIDKQTEINALTNSIATLESDISIKELQKSSVEVVIKDLESKRDATKNQATKDSIQLEINRYNLKKNAITGTTTTFDITGTVSVLSDDLKQVVGVGTLFKSEISSTDNVVINGVQRKVVTVIDDTNLTVSEDFTSTSSGQIMTTNIIGLTTLNANLTSANTELETLNGDFTSLLAQKRIIEDGFKTSLKDFIHEGLWSDSNYMTPDTLYDDGLEKSKEVSVPKVSYDMSIVDLSVLSDYRDETFDIGDIIYITDPLLKIYSKSARITKKSWNEDKPHDVQIEIANYKSNFTDLFKSIVQATSLLEQKKEYWARVENTINPDGSLSNMMLEKSYLDNKERILHSTNCMVITDDYGITVINKNNPNHQARISSDIVTMSKDGGITWKVAMTADGINAEFMTAGRLDVNKIAIYGDNNFFWSGDGLFIIEEDDPFKYVQLDREGLKLYNNVSGSPVKQLHIGKYDSTNYGLEIKNKYGNTTLINGDGILQSWGDSQADNVDNMGNNGKGHTLMLKFYIPDEMISVKSLKLNFSLEKFRAYETGAVSGGDASGLETTYSAQWRITEPMTPDVISSSGSHNHNIPNGTYLLDELGDTIRFSTAGNHAHSISPHHHKFDLPSHSHGINYGIYESTTATGVKVYIDGTLRLSNGGSGYTLNQSNLDLTQWITTSGWHTIELSSTSLGRINAAYFLQVFLGV